MTLANVARHRLMSAPTTWRSYWRTPLCKMSILGVVDGRYSLLQLGFVSSLCWVVKD